VQNPNGNARIIIIILGIIAIISVSGTIWLVHGKTPGAELAIVAAFGTGSIGVLGGLLANVNNSNKATPVHVVNSPQQAVPVEETPTV
jgi:hypothetical protein